MMLRTKIYETQHVWLNQTITHTNVEINQWKLNV